MMNGKSSLLSLLELEQDAVQHYNFLLEDINYWEMKLEREKDKNAIRIFEETLSSKKENIEYYEALCEERKQDILNYFK